MTPKFTIEEAIGFGWTKTKEHLSKFIGIGLIYFFLQILMRSPGFSKTPIIVIPLLIVALVSLYFSFVVNFGILRVSIAVADGKSFEIDDIWSLDQKILLRYFLGTIVRLLIIVVGYILLIIPGVIWTFKYMFTPYLIVDKKMTITEALKESGRMTYGYKGDLFFFYLAIVFLNILGLFALVVGLFITIPMTWISVAYVYRKLSEPASSTAMAA